MAVKLLACPDHSALLLDRVVAKYVFIERLWVKTSRFFRSGQVSIHVRIVLATCQIEKYLLYHTWRTMCFVTPMR